MKSDIIELECIDVGIIDACIVEIDFDAKVGTVFTCRGVSLNVERFVQCCLGWYFESVGDDASSEEGDLISRVRNESRGNDL